MEIEKLKTKTASHYMQIANLMNDSADFIERFPLELGPLLRELENKTEDSIYTKKVLETYLSIAKEAESNANRLLAIFEQMKEVQIEINPQNFTK
ncbi:hypothetical protein WIW50_02775 [Flavobacteriaceae bacterium 3-367]